ncbi:MAG TPA: NBR1-Ig-like domain-containing protein [Anaerolineales bacterium]|nr:NBR1-Ig-like domain-containing protein [Anaerolineales bacterium]
MRIQERHTGHKLAVLSFAVILALAACAPNDANTTPTLSVDAIFTAAAQTLRAQEATALALTPPTNTPSPSPFPTLPPPSAAATSSFVTSTPPIGGVGSQCDNAAYVSDVTIPDGTTMKPGEKFTKTWRIYNSGSCAWTTSYRINFVSGDSMGGASTALSAGIPAGSQADVSVALTAPTTNGTFKGNWRMLNASGQPFGSVIYVEIKVGAGSTVTPGPSPTGGPSPTSSGTSFTISGNAGVGSGVTVKCQGDGQKPSFDATVTNAGDYTCTVPLHWRGYVKPEKPGWFFVPEQSPLFDDVGSDGNNIDYDFTAHQ